MYGIPLHLQCSGNFGVIQCTCPNGTRGLLVEHLFVNFNLVVFKTICGPLVQLTQMALIRKRLAVKGNGLKDWNTNGICTSDLVVYKIIEVWNTVTLVHT